MTTLFDSQPGIDGDPLRFQNAQSGGLITVNAANTFVELTVNSAVTNGYAVRQSYEYVPYQPGKSKLFMATGTLMTTIVNNTVARVGCFDTGPNLSLQSNGNGHYFELQVDGSGNVSMHLVERLNGDTTTDINMPDWNYDAFGQGAKNPSGVTITPSDFIGNAFIFAMDQEWLAVGQVRMGFVFNGEFHYAHFLTHSGIPPGGTAMNQGADTNGTGTISIPYTATAKLPVRWEIRTAAGESLASPATLYAICASVQSEGGYIPTGLPFSTISPVSSTTEAMIGIRLRPEYNNRRTLLLTGIEVAGDSGAGSLGSWLLLLFTPSDSELFPGAGWTDVDSTYSGAQVANNFAVTVSEGVVLASGFIAGRASASFNFDSYIASPRVNSAINGLSRVLVLYNRDLPNQPAVYGSLSWLEIS